MSQATAVAPRSSIGAQRRRATWSRKSTEILELFPRQGQWTEEAYLALPETNHIIELSELTEWGKSIAAFQTSLWKSFRPARPNPAARSRWTARKNLLSTPEPGCRNIGSFIRRLVRSKSMSSETAYTIYWSDGGQGRSPGPRCWRGLRYQWMP